MAGERGTANSVAATALVMMIAVTLLVYVAQADLYIVGDNEAAAWGLPFDSNWVNDKNFKVGDMLEFIFDPRANDVMEVSMSDYSICQATPGKNVWKGEPAIVNLTTAETHYFISSNYGNCTNGLKTAVTTSN
ncbi:early nodulin-like protein 8 [Striga asiatica]|uniref:Early nodulin-like protein 8 n=1 Tax=Striga asiatica TaxID=4170 RepID=A0A5A7QEX7_STRAF|nr:early nodulin-like protein 8 [Striga asiatica]